MGISAVMAVASVGSAVNSYNQAKDQKKAYEKQKTIQQKRESAERRIQRVEAFRQRMMAQDAAKTSSVASGSDFGSSTYQASVASIDSQLATNASRGLQQDGFQTAYNNANFSPTPSLWGVAKEVTSAFGGDAALADFSKNIFTKK